MADQSYNYGYDSGGGPGREKKRGDWAYWIIALVLLLTFMPGGILMIVLKLAGGGRKKSRPRGRHPYYMQKEQGQMGARTVPQPRRRPSRQQPAIPDGLQGQAPYHCWDRPLRHFRIYFY